MKNTLLSLALAGSMLIAGCASPNGVPSSDSPNYPMYIQQVESDVKTYSGLSVSIYLLSNTEGAERIKVARHANSAAKAVIDAIDDGQSLADLKVFAKQLIVDDAENSDAVLVGLLFDYITHLIENKLDVELKITDPGQRMLVGMKLVKAAAQSVADATETVANQPITWVLPANPTTQPVVHEDDVNI